MYGTFFVVVKVVFLLEFQPLNCGLYQHYNNKTLHKASKVAFSEDPTKTITIKQWLRLHGLSGFIEKIIVDDFVRCWYVLIAL